MLPLLRLIADGKEYSLKTLIEDLAASFKLTEEERAELLPSGQSFVFSNRAGWARTYLKKAGLLSAPRRGFLQITDRGLDVLSRKPTKIDANLLKEFPEFLEFQNFKREEGSVSTKDENTAETLINQTPQELIDGAYRDIRASLAQELLEKIKALSPIFFEKLVLDLLLKMGYGGSIKDAGKATRLTNDEGIDGIIKEDKLGLDFIYIQAKRWTDNAVGRPDVQSFVGALDGQRATKGIFITTSTFSNNARDYVRTISKKVILINGQELAEYMIDYGLGVSTVQTFELKRIDSDYFEE